LIHNGEYLKGVPPPASPAGRRKYNSCSCNPRRAAQPGARSCRMARTEACHLRSGRLTVERKVTMNPGRSV
jgi:hypothetical protein